MARIQKGPRRQEKKKKTKPKRQMPARELAQWKRLLTEINKTGRLPRASNPVHFEGCRAQMRSWGIIDQRNRINFVKLDHRRAWLSRM